MIRVLALGIARRVLDAPLGRSLASSAASMARPLLPYEDHFADVMVNINIVDLFGFALDWFRADSVCYWFKLSCFLFRSLLLR